MRPVRLPRRSHRPPFPRATRRWLRSSSATGRRLSERLENIRVDTGRRIARVSADFVFVDEGAERPGKLGLHLAEGKDGWRIVAVLFAYDAE